ncbi:MAG: hypothetical protein KJO11_17130, partial [Gemmatimonadetes bacterium]|nr:hypothetical protein [Gemmatimonadota bacterium]
SREGTAWPSALLALLLVLALRPPAVAAQERPTPAVADTLVEVVLEDGTTLIGRVTEVDAGTVVLETPGGARITLERSSIASITIARGRVVGRDYWISDPNDTRLYFASTGRTLARGEGYVGTYIVVLPFIGYGVTDRFTLAAGAPVLFGSLQPVYIAPKFQVIRADAARVSIGTLAFLSDGEVGGVAYGIATLGTRDVALHLGAGLGFAGDDLQSEPVAMIGGEARVSPRVKLLTENYLIPDDDSDLVFSFGLRLIGERLSTDIGVAGVAGDDSGCCLPLINFSYAFGGAR